ncbi:MAG: sugar isomerase domain-containing protein [Sciscionella sp.]
MSAQRYFTAVTGVIEQIVSTAEPVISEAAEAIVSAMARGHTLWAFGTGHSALLAEELQNRAGGLATIRGILEPSVMLASGAAQASAMERLPGLAEIVLRSHPVDRGDVVIVISNSGRNAVPVEFAEGVRARGATVIALTALEHAKTVPSVAPSGRRLHEIADLVIDNHGSVGDAAVRIPGVDEAVGPTSTVAGALILQALVCEIAERLQRRGAAVPVVRSNNLVPVTG